MSAQIEQDEQMGLDGSDVVLLGESSDEEQDMRGGAVAGNALLDSLGVGPVAKEVLRKGVPAMDSARRHQLRRPRHGSRCRASLAVRSPASSTGEWHDWVGSAKVEFDVVVMKTPPPEPLPMGAASVASPEPASPAIAGSYKRVHANLARCEPALPALPWRLGPRALAHAVLTMAVGEQARFTFVLPPGTLEPWDEPAASAGPQVVVEGGPSPAAAEDPRERLELTVELDDVQVQLDVDGDGTVRKRIVREGARQGSPKAPCTVLLDYTLEAKDGGHQMRRRGVEHRLGVDPELLPGLDAAIQTMTQGERALVTLRPLDGSPASEYRCDVTLIRWLEEVEVTQDGRVIKQVLATGVGVMCPSEMSDVRFHFRAVVARDERTAMADTATAAAAAHSSGLLSEHELSVVADSPGPPHEPHRWVLGEPPAGPVCAGMDLALRTMVAGESCRLHIEPPWSLDADAAELLDVRPNVTLTVDMTLVSFETESATTSSPEMMLVAAERRRAHANKLFDESDGDVVATEQACVYFSGALDVLATIPLLHEAPAGRPFPLARAVDSARRACWLNRGHAFLLLGKWAEAREDLTCVLEHNPDNAKARYRRAVALIELGEATLAVEDLEACLTLMQEARSTSSLPEVEAMLARARAAIREDRRRESAMARRMFAN